MKAERRHELQTNALARFIENVPLYFQFHFWKIIAGALVIVLVILLVRYRINSAREAEQMIAVSMTQVRQLLNELQIVDLRFGNPADRAAQRRQIAAQAEGFIEQILQQTEEPEDSAIRAEALAARGDLNWILANLPRMPEAATQPTLELPQTSDAYLDAAEGAYEQVLKQYPDRHISAITAMFGLGAIAENRGQWDAARARYEEILKKADVGPMFELFARARIEQLATIRDPVYFGTLTTQPALPTTFDLTALPDEPPATSPTTGPAGPVPTTAPAATQP